QPRNHYAHHYRGYRGSAACSKRRNEALSAECIFALDAHRLSRSFPDRPPEEERLENRAPLHAGCGPRSDCADNVRLRRLVIPPAPNLSSADHSNERLRREQRTRDNIYDRFVYRPVVRVTTDLGPVTVMLQ